MKSELNLPVHAQDNFVFDAAGENILCCYVGPTMAEEIARRVNCHDELVGILKAVLDSENSTLGDGGSILGDDIRTTVWAVLSEANSEKGQT